MIKIIGIFIALGLVIWVLRRWARRHGAIEEHVEDIKKDIETWGNPSAGCSTCSSSTCCSSGCSTPTPKKKEVVYYDDEELDRFARRTSTDYTPEEVEEFREILTTLYPQEVNAWLKSLEQRFINLPIALQEEAHQLIESAKGLQR